MEDPPIDPTVQHIFSQLTVDPSSDDFMVLEKVKLELNQKHHVFLTGPGGCGKSHLIRSLKKFFDTTSKVFSCTASTGVAAVNIEGQTIHRFSGIQIGKGTKEQLLTRIRGKNKNAVKNIRKVNILCIDEISMLDASIFDKLDYIFRNIRGKNDPFGGVVLLLAGDFLQLPPVEGDFVFRADVWKKMEIYSIHLIKPKRFNDLSFFETLLRVRKGEVTDEDFEKLLNRVTAYQEFKKTGVRVSSNKEIVPVKSNQIQQRWVEKNVTTNEDVTVKPTLLFSVKKDVEEINKKELAKLPGAIRIYSAKDVAGYYDLSDLLAEPLEMNTHYSDILNGLTPNELPLKLGAQVMLTVNLDVESELCNGSRGVVVGMEDDGVLVKFITAGTVLIPFNVFKHEEETELRTRKLSIRRKQIPLILAFATTIHKSQGSTLDFCVIDLGPTVFSCGQAYVALSRARNWDSVLIHSLVKTCFKTDPDALEYTLLLEKSERIAPNFQTDSCCICMDELSPEETPFQCGHTVHKECMKQYGKFECPFCRKALVLQ